MGIKPPLIAVLPTPIYLLVGRHPRAAYAINLLFLLVMFGALYRMGKTCSSPRAGMLALYISGTMPILYGLSRWFLVECRLTALVCAAMCLVAEWDDFARTWKGFLLGIVCGLGVLTKVSFPVYVLVPLLYCAIRDRRAMLHPRTLLAFVAPALLLAAPWYLVNFSDAVSSPMLYQRYFSSQSIQRRSISRSRTGSLGLWPFTG
jgi:4-amino-4-deoxy-L-arabinose transferase-like glycosyltransferase